jgi:hypothetical protein
MKTVSTLFFLLLIFMVSPVCGVESQTVKVGVYYYPWFDSTYTGTPDYPDRKNWSHPFTQDEPYKGFYNSTDTDRIKQHIAWFEDLAIDFVILSWWGKDSYTDNCSKIMFETFLKNATSTKLCIMVEPFNGTESDDRYNFTAIYKYIHLAFYEPYEGLYFHIADGYGNVKPLILFFNADNFTSNNVFERDNNRFTVKISGHHDYAEWIYNHYDAFPWKEWIKHNYQLPQCRCFPVSPRYDDQHLGRGTDYRVDITYEENTYTSQWSEALTHARENAIDVVTICSWNEYNERTQIEPHYDNDAFDPDPFYLYNITKQYIQQLKETEPPPWWRNPLVLGVILIGIALGIASGIHLMARSKEKKQ